MSVAINSITFDSPFSQVPQRTDNDTPLPFGFGEKYNVTINVTANASLENARVSFGYGAFVNEGEAPPTLLPFEFFAPNSLPSTAVPMADFLALNQENGTVSILFSSPSNFDIILTDFIFRSDLDGWLTDNSGLNNSLALLASSTNDRTVLGEDLQSIWINDSVKRLAFAVNVATESQNQVGQQEFVQITAYDNYTRSLPQYQLAGAKFGEFAVDWNNTDQYANQWAVIPVSSIGARFLKVSVWEDGVEIYHTSSTGVFTSVDPTSYPTFPQTSPVPNPLPGDSEFFIGRNHPSPPPNNIANATTATGKDVASLENSQPNGVLIEQVLFFQVQSGSSYQIKFVADPFAPWYASLWVTGQSNPSPSTDFTAVRYLSTNATFLNQGVMTNPTFTGGLSNSITSNEIALTINHSAIVEAAAAYLLKSSNFDNSVNFLEGYDSEYQDLPAVTNEGGGLYSTTLTALGSDVIEGETYYVLVIYADENGLVNSFLSEPIEASNLDSGLMTGSATVFIYEDRTYPARVSLSPTNRVRVNFLGTVPSGSTVNRFEINIPDFGIIQGVNQNGAFSNSNTFQDAEILPYCSSQQNGQDVEISLVFRIPDEWANSSQTVRCTFLLNNSQEQEQFLEVVFEVEEFEELKLAPDVIEDISILENYTPGDSVFCENLFPNSNFAAFPPFSRIPDNVTLLDGVVGSRSSTTAIEITNNTSTGRHDLLFRLPGFSFSAGHFFSIYVNAAASDQWTLQSRSVEGDFFVAYNGTDFVLNLAGGTTSIDIIERVDLGNGWTQNTFRTNTNLNFPSASQFLIFYAGISTTIPGVSFTPSSVQTFTIQLQVTENPNYGIIDTTGAAIAKERCEPELNTCGEFDTAYIVATKKAESEQQKHFVVHQSNALQKQEAESFTVTPLPQITQLGIPTVDEEFTGNFAEHTATQAQINQASEVAVIVYPENRPLTFDDFNIGTISRELVLFFNQTQKPQSNIFWKGNPLAWNGLFYTNPFTTPPIVAETAYNNLSIDIQDVGTLSVQGFARDMSAIFLQNGTLTPTVRIDKSPPLAFETITVNSITYELNGVPQPSLTNPTLNVPYGVPTTTSPEGTVDISGLPLFPGDVIKQTVDYDASAYGGGNVVQDAFILVT